MNRESVKDRNDMTHLLVEPTETPKGDQSKPKVDDVVPTNSETEGIIVA